MRSIWIDSAREDLERAKKKFSIGDFKNVCIIARISATKSIYSALSEVGDVKYIDDLNYLYNSYKNSFGVDGELDEAVNFLSRFVLYEDIVTPFVVEKWGGLPTERDASRAIYFAELLIKKMSKSP